jgi:hypothetical protein
MSEIDKFLLFYIGGKIEQVALRGIDIRNILPRNTNRQFTIIFYHDIPQKLINGINIIVFINQGAEYGHWCFIDIDEETKKIYFLIRMVIHRCSMASLTEPRTETASRI